MSADPDRAVPAPSDDGETPGDGRDVDKDLDPGEGRFAYSGLDRLLHEKARLGILSSLLTHEDGGLLFTQLKSLCSLTDGNLSRHLQALSEAGLVDVQKADAPRRSPTRCVLTANGRERFLEYLAELERVIEDARSSQSLASPHLRPERRRHAETDDGDEFSTGWAPV